MPKHSLIFYFLWIAFSIKAQDTLYFKNAEKVIIVLLEVNPDNIKYKHFYNQAGPTYTTLKSELSYIILKNGRKEDLISQGAIEKPVIPVKDSLKKETVETIFAGDTPDTLYFASGKMSVVKILFTGDKEVRYKLFDFQEGPTYLAALYELKKVIYANGKMLDFTESVKADIKTTSSHTVSVGENKVNKSLYEKGRQDALKYYKHKVGAVGVSFATAGSGCLIGLIPTLIVSNCAPKRKNLGIPNSEYSQRLDYIKGYTDKAYEMKKERVWTGYGIGVGVFAAAIIGLVIASIL